MDFVKNILIIFLISLTIGCATCKKDIQLNKVKLPDGYSLVLDNEQKIRVKCPDGYVTGCQWETVEIAVEYCKSYNEWVRHTKCDYNVEF